MPSFNPHAAWEQSDDSVGVCKRIPRCPAAEHVTVLVKERMADVVVCHRMAGDLGSILFLKMAVLEEMLHRLYV